MILAQGALESGWGTSFLAREHRNYFGIMGYGASNGYWHGERARIEGANGVHYFRRYGGVEVSFLDFARLIRSGYHRAWNREQYRRSLVAVYEQIVTLKDMYDWMRGRAA